MSTSIGSAESESQSLLLHLVGLRNRLFSALDLAEEHGDAYMLATISSQLHRNLETTGKLLGDLGVGATTINNILVSPQYLELRQALCAALRPHPAAAQAVSAALRALENKAADSHPLRPAHARDVALEGGRAASARRRSTPYPSPRPGTR